ncbi:hypothetical protein ESB00_02790 [Oleiharenicola lentus]|uniref:Uncharacterized protein n=1 Tax=Oleiharenicola lentus TaxID=2508720 RepID=A0A4Q1C7Q9_9BACT|nr:hypothetical protein [Oleiharenicola lentus]RXK54841.1 hypothetical protein ESB00_02790 [Oleiharenicola lentus]
MATAQQSIPADIAARDKELRDSIQREDIRTRGIEQRAHMESLTRDMVRRFWEEPWLAKSAGSQHDLVFPPVLPPVLHGLGPAEPVGAYPDFLATYAGEPFFMACGNSAFAGLNDWHQFYRASRYAESRDELVAELRAKLAAVTSLTPEQQRAELAVFAAAQAKALRDLEAEAEGTREEFNYLDDGRALMKERKSLTPDEATRLRTYYAALRGAHYMPGLSIEQRQLLESVAHENSTAPDPATRVRPSFFLPASARIRWQHSDDAQLNAHWASFQQLRRELAEQLVQSALELPPKISRAAARKLHARLAEQQANRFAELDRLAEEIRLALAKNPGLKAPADSGHPPEVLRLAGELRDRNRRFQDRTAQLLLEMNRRFAPSRFRLGSANDVPTIELEPAGTDAAPKAGKRSQQNHRLREANEWLAETQRKLLAAGEEAAKAIQNYHATLDPRQAPGVQELTESLVQSYLDRENWHRFADYRTAVLTPGLSPAQRRLLFNAALRDLEQQRLQAAY